MSATELPENLKAQLIEAAKSAVQKAYAPYSRFRVGAAILTKQGELFTGCNVENASYGLSMCAERVAIGAAIAQRGAELLQIQAIAVVNDQNVPCSPCGACRQVIYEFGPNALVIFQGRDRLEIKSATELLPEGFRL